MKRPDFKVWFDAFGAHIPDEFEKLKEVIERSPSVTVVNSDLAIIFGTDKGNNSILINTDCKTALFENTELDPTGQVVFSPDEGGKLTILGEWE